MSRLGQIPYPVRHSVVQDWDAAFAARVEAIATIANSGTEGVTCEMNTSLTRVSDLAIAVTELSASLPLRRASHAAYYSEISAKTRLNRPT